MTSPNGATPEGSLGRGLFRARQLQTEAEAKAQMTNGAIGAGGAWTGAQHEFKINIKDLLNLLKDRADAFEDGQIELNGRTDLLSPLLDYGSAYMDTSGGFSNVGQAWFVHQVGPMQKCHLDQGRIILEEEGLWDIRASMWFDSTGLGGGVGWNVRVLRPNGTLFSEKMEYFDDTKARSALSISSVVVPAAGYQVQVYVTVIAATRGIIGGVQRNRLTVQHISRDITTGDTGQG